MFGRKKQPPKSFKDLTIEDNAKYIRDKVIEIYGDELGSYGGTAKSADEVQELIARLLKEVMTQNDPVRSRIQDEADRLAFDARSYLTHGRVSDKIAKALAAAEERGARRAALPKANDANSESYQKGYDDGYVDGAIDMRSKAANYMANTNGLDAVWAPKIQELEIPRTPKKPATT